MEDIKIKRGEVLAKRRDKLGYETYIISVNNNDYIMVTKLPTWNLKDQINIGDIGFVKYKNVVAGQDTFYNQETGNYEVYKFTDSYIMDFVKEG